MRYVVLLVLACILTGCATVDFQSYEGKDNLYEGEGGTKLVVGDIDFWINGAPPRKYSILGMVASEIGSGSWDEAVIRSAVASEVRKQGGNAAVQVNNNSAFTGTFHAAPGMFMTTEVRRMQFAVIKYVD